MAYTGDLQPSVFDHLMLVKTTFPPVVEGCSAREACEFTGRPFIRGGSMHEPLAIYTITDEESSTCQNIHAKASQCLRKGNPEDVPYLVTYMCSASTTENFQAYHRQRRVAFLNRPDACETALRELSTMMKSLNPHPHTSGLEYIKENGFGSFTSRSMASTSPSIEESLVAEKALHRII
jgi:hypothetical protein